MSTGPCSRLYLPANLIETLCSEALAAGDVEICGFIAGRGENFARYPIVNRAPARRRRFDMDAANQIAAFKTMRKQGQQLIAIYHSHPDAPAVPSTHDIAGHSYPEAVALIIAPHEASGGVVRAWRIKQDEVVPIKLMS